MLTNMIEVCVSNVIEDVFYVKIFSFKILDLATGRAYGNNHQLTRTSKNVIYLAT